jgi:hypothetical protein
MDERIQKALFFLPVPILGVILAAAMEHSVGKASFGLMCMIAGAVYLAVVFLPEGRPDP